MRLTKARYLFRHCDASCYAKFPCVMGLPLNNFLYFFVSLQIDRSRGEKGGFGPLQSMGSGRIENAFSEMSISSSGSGFGSGSGLGGATDFESSFSSKAKGMCLLFCMNLCFLLLYQWF